MAKVLILAGDAAEDLETMFIKYRLIEAGYEPHRNTFGHRAPDWR